MINRELTGTLEVITENLTASLGYNSIWGDISGDIEDQQDLQDALDEKQDEITSTNKLNANLISGLSNVATSGSYNDLTNKPAINDSTLTLTKNDVSIGTFTANAAADKTINIEVPTRVVDLSDYDEFAKKTYVSSAIDTHDVDTQAHEDIRLEIAQKQDTLTAGNNITISNNVISATSDVTDVKVNTVSVVTNKVANISVPTKTSDIINDSGFIDNTYHDATKQNTLVSGTNIKTINNSSILGSGDITIGGNVDDVQVNGASVVTNKVANIVLNKYAISFLNGKLTIVEA